MFRNTSNRHFNVRNWNSRDLSEFWLRSIVVAESATFHLFIFVPLACDFIANQSPAVLFGFFFFFLSLNLLSNKLYVIIYQFHWVFGESNQQWLYKKLKDWLLGLFLLFSLRILAHLTPKRSLELWARIGAIHLTAGRIIRYLENCEIWADLYVLI